MDCIGCRRLHQNQQLDVPLPRGFLLYSLVGGGCGWGLQFLTWRASIVCKARDVLCCFLLFVHLLHCGRRWRGRWGDVVVVVVACAALGNAAVGHWAMLWGLPCEGGGCCFVVVVYLFFLFLSSIVCSF